MKWAKVIFILLIISFGADAGSQVPTPVYGLPTLYGEYELSRDDISRVSNMYGNVSVPHIAPIRIGTPKGVAGEKTPIKNKKAAPKKKIMKKKKPKQTPVSKPVIPEPVPDVAKDDVATPIADVVTPIAENVAPVSSPIADAIAARVADKIDIDSFCTHVKHQGKGNLPDGIIMMPGRPDLMSCVSNNKKLNR